MSTRPSRRATRRTAVVESSDDEIADMTQQAADNSEDDFTPAPTRSPRKSTAGRRKTMADTTATAPKRGRPRKSVATASVEPTQTMDPDETAMTRAAVESEDPEKKASPRKRKSVAPRASKPTTPELPPPMPTPKPSASPEPSEITAMPLGDITNTVNEQRQPSEDTLAAVKPIKSTDTILEKPMDIVLKSRTMTIPVQEDLTPKARIVITYLVLTNFKSYAGRQEVGPFHASFSSVVGPNGSGKSNVIDALLFVFGFRASKMRQGKLSALIHNSAEHPNLDYCEVSVSFHEVMDVVSGGPRRVAGPTLILLDTAWWPTAGHPQLRPCHLTEGFQEQLQPILHQRQDLELHGRYGSAT